MPLFAEPKLLDVTVRDGSFQIYHSMTAENTARIAQGLAEAGVEYAEISHGCGIGAKLQGMPAKADDEEMMEAAKKVAPNLRLSAIVVPSDLSTALLPALVDYLDIGRVFGVVSQPELAEKTFQKLVKYEIKGFAQLVRTHRYTPEAVAESASRFEAMGAEAVYIVDSFGSMFPEDVRSYVQAIQSRCKIEIGFHGHNHIGMAIPNTLEAWRAGATWLDASLMGVGRDGGNTQLEALVDLLQIEGQAANLSLARLCKASQEAVLPVFEHAPSTRYVDLLLSRHRLDYANKEYLILLANSIHVPLRDFFAVLEEKLGEGIQVTDETIKATVESFGQDLEQLTATFEKKPGDHEKKPDKAD
ncbi:hypothetical protein F9K50_01755 [bacterium]|nr:MAG: hypothetical protein F9K50_01755 [bacterium]